MVSNSDITTIYKSVVREKVVSRFCCQDSLNRPFWVNSQAMAAWWTDWGCHALAVRRCRLIQTTSSTAGIQIHQISCPKTR